LERGGLFDDPNALAETIIALTDAELVATRDVFDLLRGLGDLAAVVTERTGERDPFGLGAMSLTAVSLDGPAAADAIPLAVALVKSFGTEYLQATLAELLPPLRVFTEMRA
jgi:hypothetical protein